MHSIPLAATPRDGRDYRLYKHANGLRCLLISDPEASLATCVAQVDVGSEDEPGGHPGLAHLLEHMLFMGSEGYPPPGSFPALVNRYAGRFNASTAAQITRFFFSVGPDGLSPCIEQLGDMLCAPLFLPSLVGAERQVIDAEFHTRMADDALHQQAAMAAVLDPAHPMSRFRAGNAVSLTGTDADLAQHLRGFHQQHYRAADMLLVLHAKQTPAALLSLAMAFADRQIPGGRPKRCRSPLFPPNRLPCHLQRETVQGSPRWQLVYPLTGLDWLGHDSSGAWLCEWIASPAPAGALGWLRGSGLIAELDVRIEVMAENQALLHVELEPLLKLENYQQLLDAWQSWLNWLLEVNPQSWPVAARTRLLDQAFARGRQGDPVEWLKDLAHRLMRLPVDYLLEPSANRQPVNAQRWRRLLDQLQPTRLLLVQPHRNTTWAERTPWTGTGYTLSKLTWRAPVLKAPLQSDLGPDFDCAMGSNNPVACITQLPGLRQHDLPARDSHNQHSGQQVQTRLAWCWPMGQSTRAQRYLLQSCWALQIEPIARRAELSGVRIAWRQDAGVLSLTLSGLADGTDSPLPGILRSVLGAITKPPTPGLLDLACHRLYCWQAEQAAQLPAYRCLSELDAWLLADAAECDFSLDDQMTATTALNLLRHLREQAQLLWLKPPGLPASTLDGHLMASAFPGLKRSFGWVEPRPSVLQPGIESRSIAVLAPDRCQLLYCQAPSGGVLERAGWRLLQQLLASPFFDDLRTRQQLGYWVVARYYPIAGVPGLVFLVQSPSHDHKQITRAVDQFLLEQQELVAAMPFVLIKAQAERLAQALQAQLSAADCMFEECWSLLLGREDQRLETECEVLRGLHAEQWQAVQSQLWGRASRLRLASESNTKVADQVHLQKHSSTDAL